MFVDCCKWILNVSKYEIKFYMLFPLQCESFPSPTITSSGCGADVALVHVSLR